MFHRPDRPMTRVRICKRQEVAAVPGPFYLGATAALVTSCARRPGWGLRENSPQVINYEMPLIYNALSGLEKLCILHGKGEKTKEKNRGPKFTAHERSFTIHFLAPFCKLCQPSAPKKEGGSKEARGGGERRRRRRVTEQRPGYHARTLVVSGF